MEEEVKINKKSESYNSIGYWAFVVAGVFFTFFATDDFTGPMFLCLAFIFDPFDANVPFGKRKKWQQIWLISHVIVALSAIIWTFVV